MTLDKQVVMQIFGSLMLKPDLLSEVDSYSLIPSDFETSFEQYIFMSIANLRREGAQKIEVIDIDGYLSEKPHIHEIFEKYNGIEYLQDAMEFAEPDNFKYYYNTFKKYCAIKDLQKLGYDTNNIYPEKDLLSEEDYKKREKFDELTPTDIFSKIKTDLAAAEAKYGCAAVTTVKANANIRELIKSFKESPEIGAPFQGSCFNTITRGARLGKFYLISALSGVGKTRTMVGEACNIAYPIKYDQTQQRWINRGSCEKVLYIGTEQKHDEIQSMILAHLTGINEETIINGTFNEKEEELLCQAAQIMDIYQDNFKISQLPEPNLTQVKTHLRNLCLSEGYEYVFYDYIFATPSLLNEFRDLAIRQDVALRMLSTLLKDLAVELNCFIMSATQITGAVEFKPGYIRNYMLLRDSKSIPDKADFAAIKARVLPEELELLSDLCHGCVPNQVTDVYKMRRGRYVDVRIWSYADLGSCRSKDLFVTDANLKPIPTFVVREMFLDYDANDYEKIKETLSLFETGELGEQLEETLISNEIEESIDTAAEIIEAEEVIEADESIPSENWEDLF